MAVCFIYDHSVWANTLVSAYDGDKNMMRDKITAFVIGAAFSTVVYFAGMAKGQTSIPPREAIDPLAKQATLMTMSECIGLMGRIGGAK